MPKNQEIKIRVSKLQYAEIMNETELRGYKNVSTFLRESALTQRKHIELKIIETNKLHFETNNEIKKIKERIDKIMEILKNPKL